MVTSVLSAHVVSSTTVALIYNSKVTPASVSSLENTSKDGVFPAASNFIP